MGRTRTHEIHLCLDDREYAALKSNAEKCGLSQQSYLRDMCRNTVPRERPSLEAINILRSLQQINNNMNQLAFKANTMGFIDTAAYWENVSWLQEIVSMLIEKLYE